MKLCEMEKKSITINKNLISHIKEIIAQFPDLDSNADYEVYSRDLALTEIDLLCDEFELNWH